jgi:small subunit ribosomal protein S16
MLGIRLKRTGRTNDPSFKIVVGERKYSPKSGKHFEYLGSYNPKTKHTIINAEAVKGWLAKGAQASGTVHNLLLKNGIITGKKVDVNPKKVLAKKEEPKEEPKPAVVAEAPAEAPIEAPAETETAS